MFVSLMGDNLKLERRISGTQVDMHVTFCDVLVANLLFPSRKRNLSRVGHFRSGVIEEGRRNNALLLSCPLPLSPVRIAARSHPIDG